MDAFIDNPQDPEEQDVEVLYRRDIHKKEIIITVLVIAAALAAVASLFVSQLDSLTPDHVIKVLSSHLFGTEYDNEIYDMVVWDYNVPRTLLGVVVGASLAIGGCVMQTILRNPLATPYTTGVSAGASMGAALYIYLDFALYNTGGYITTIAVNAMVFALVPTVAILMVSRQKHITPTTMILAGIAIMYIFSAATTLLMLLSDPDNVQEAYEWNIGSLGRATWSNIGYVIAVTIVCMILLQLLSRQLYIMNSGNRAAQTMGVSVRAVRNWSLVITAIMTATTVSITGGIGFMGLVAPHIARIMVGSNTKYLMPCSAALGALILLIADAVSRVIIQEGIPVGVLTAVVGGPIFIIILIKGARKVWF